MDLKCLFSFCSALVLGVAGLQAQTQTFTYQGNVFQTYTVPESGWYLLDASGAQGGSASNGKHIGGYGARMQGYVQFNAGDVLRIAVGGAGGQVANERPVGYGGGGGGASSVVRIVNGIQGVLSGDDELLLMAGGVGTATITAVQGGSPVWQEASWSQTVTVVEPSATAIQVDETGSFMLTVTGKKGMEYILETTEDIKRGQWEKLKTIVLAGDNHEEGLTLSGSVQFYRIEGPLGWKTIDQGINWTWAGREKFWIQDQGVRNIPYSWLDSLRDAKGRPFLFDRLERYGFIPIQGRKLPIGFAMGLDGTGRTQVGFTCAACHTREIEVQGERYRIDGAPTLANVEQYNRELDAAMQTTVEEPGLFDAFLNRVITLSSGMGDPSITSKEDLRSEVLKWQQKQHIWTSLTLPYADIWGVGRLDALNQIINRCAAEHVSSDRNSLIVENLRPANRPVRPPFLWNVNKQDFTQWAGTSANGNTDLALKRNYGQVLGVGVHLVPVVDPTKEGGLDMLTNNTANFGGLLALEELVGSMGSPKWPWTVNTETAALGKVHYENHCASCHEITPGELRPPNLQTWSTPVMDVGTDRSYYEIFARTGHPGILENLLPSPTALVTLVKTLSELSLKQYQPDIVFDYPVPSRSVGSYESRVLEGIWASAPYLHNGSVPTLDDLLKPAEQRPATFHVGTNFDIQKVGLSTNQPPREGFFYDTQITGNSNAGHEYGTTLTEQERSHLLEYLKTL